MTPRERVIVALDYESADKAIKMVSKLAGKVGMFKIGIQLFTACGPEIVRRIVDMGEKVFLDLKLHDIPTVVSSAAVAAMRLGASMLTVHVSGGKRMLSETLAALEGASCGGAKSRPLLIGVTLLTSLSSEEMAELGYSDSAQSHVLRLALLAKQCGLDGIVASPLEVGFLRRQGLKGLIAVTPAIRVGGVASDDQRRIASPAEAIEAGADYLVIGRPITGAPDPEAVVQQIVTEMEAAMSRLKG